ncbi:MAG TPA: hypothetical protein VE445_00685 [Nitrososphaeraceae archaeon]|nr:hypothetical protein [Nitrososphaeraceae archaeon]
MPTKILQGKCALCGKDLEVSDGRLVVQEEVINGIHYDFDTEDCAAMFKKFESVYGNDFWLDITR